MNTPLYRAQPSGWGDLTSDIRNVRVAVGLSQKKLGILLGIKQHTVSQWESGRRPKLSMLAPLADVLDLDVSLLCLRVEAERTLSIRERLFSGLMLSESDCLTWTKAVGSGGYGLINIDGQMVYVHITMFELFADPVPEGMELDHLCHTRDLTCPGGITCLHRRCANVAHLEPVTHRTNMHRGRSPSAANAAKETCPSGHDYDYVYPNGNRRCRKCQPSRLSGGARAAIRAGRIPVLRGSKS